MKLDVYWEYGVFTLKIIFCFFGNLNSFEDLPFLKVKASLFLKYSNFDQLLLLLVFEANIHFGLVG